MPHRLLLFDIDGTLITSGGAGEGALKDAVQQFLGEDEDLKSITIAGATDSGIARALLKAHGREQTPENIAGLIDRYLTLLPERLTEHPGRVLPGILELLTRLRACEGVAMALLTGNMRRGAEIKLSHYGVWHFFEFGAFADDHHDRNELGKFAAARARDAHGVEFEADQIYVIGDTPRDIACGRAIGAKTVAIATGNYSRKELAKDEPDFLFDDFSDVDSVYAALTR